MISLQKTGRNEALLRFDLDGAKQLLAALSSLEGAAGPPGEITADVDAALLGRHAHELRRYLVRIAKQQARVSDGSVSFEGTDVVWRLVEAEGEIEYAIKRFEDAIDSGRFEPAEFLMVKIPKAEHLVQIFGEVV
jgi:hypothetical protein